MSGLLKGFRSYEAFTSGSFPPKFSAPIVVNLYAGSKKSLGGATKYIMTASIVGFRFRMPPGGGEVFFVIFFFLFVTALNGSVSAHSITTKSFEIRNSLGTVGNKVYSYASAFNFVSVTS